MKNLVIYKSSNDDTSKDLLYETNQDHVTIIATADGFIHAIDSDSKEKWSIDLGNFYYYCVDIMIVNIILCFVHFYVNY